MSLDTALPPPAAGRTFSATRRIRLADRAADGRYRLDALARHLQDAAIDDVAETGWGVPEHLWFVRRIRVDVLQPLVDDTEVELVTWCSGVAALAAGRRWSVTGNAGGRVEVDSVWVHLDRDGRPQRIGPFGVYEEAAEGRSVSTRFVLPDPSPAAPRRPWPLRTSDVDPHGHVNNAVHWAAVEDVLVAAGRIEPAQAHRAELEYRAPLDLGDPLEVVHAAGPDARRLLGFLVGDEVRAVAAVEPSGA